MCIFECVRRGEQELCAAEESEKKMNEETHFCLVQIPGKSKTSQVSVHAHISKV